MRLNALLAILLIAIAIGAMLEPKPEPVVGTTPRRDNVWVASTPAFGPSTPSFWPTCLAATQADQATPNEPENAIVQPSIVERTRINPGQGTVAIDYSLPYHVYDQPQPWAVVWCSLRQRLARDFRPAILVLFEQPQIDEPAPFDQAVQYAVETMREEWRRNRF